MRSRHLSRIVHRAPQDVYDVAADPDTLPRWAAGLAGGQVEREGEALVVHSPMGRVRVRFTARNELGVLDHDVTLPSGATVHNPMRVLPHPEGAEVLFTLRQLDLSDEEFERDARMVEDDLDRLKRLVEG
ncbi:MAG TPA: SRPBCC family protein [Ornithinimicrobium sp.]|nr:SRPBCC family protein [Ornithinimicrobium sp.]